MARVRFTDNIQRHVDSPPAEADGQTVREVLDRVFRDHVEARGYVLDEHGGVRRHMIVFVDGRAVRDRAGLSDPVEPDSEVFIMQALSGG